MKMIVGTKVKILGKGTPSWTALFLKIKMS